MNKKEILIFSAILVLVLIFLFWVNLVYVDKKIKQVENYVQNENLKIINNIESSKESTEMNIVVLHEKINKIKFSIQDDWVVFRDEVLKIEVQYPSDEYCYMNYNPGPPSDKETTNSVVCEDLYYARMAYKEVYLSGSLKEVVEVWHKRDRTGEGRNINYKQYLSEIKDFSLGELQGYEYIVDSDRKVFVESLSGLKFKIIIGVDSVLSEELLKRFRFTD